MAHWIYIKAKEITMQKTLIKQVALLLLSLSSSFAVAQKTGELPILPTPNGAIIRWYLPNQTFPSQGFRLERTNPDGSRSNIVIQSPMPKNEVEQSKLLDPKLFDYLQKLYSNPPKDSNEKFQRGIFDLKALTDPSMARVMGVLYEDKGLQANKKYVYRVLALTPTPTLIGSSSVITGQTPDVPVVQKIIANQIPNRITLTWAEPSQGNADIVAYRVFKAENNNIFVPVQVQPLFPSGKTPNFVDDKISATKIYQYSISSIDVFGREGKRSAAIRVDASLSAPLTAPRILEIATPDDRLELRFTPTQDNRVTQILIYRGSNIDKLVLLTKIDANATSFTDLNVRGGTAYAYALAVQSGTSISPRSAARVATAINTTPPKAPSNLKISSTTKTITLTWAASPEPDVWGYLIYRANTRQTTLKDAALLNQAPIKTTTYTDTLTEGSNQEFTYQIITINTSAIRSQPSLISLSLIDKTPPATPTLFNVTSLENSIGLTFSSSDPDTVQILIYRISPQGRLQLVKKLAANATGYIDTSPIPNLPYVYTIIAIDAKGNRSQPSNRMVGTAVLTQAPPTPMVTLQIKNNTATLTWTRTKPRTYYILYQQRNNQWIQITEVIDATTYTLKNIKKGEKYAIRATDLAGNLSPFSNTLEIR
jgi:hypothetical protein